MTRFIGIPLCIIGATVSSIGLSAQLDGDYNASYERNAHLLEGPPKTNGCWHEELPLQRQTFTSTGVPTYWQTI